ncbi:MAG: PqqD family protein [Lachnospiraceae bacterium]|nr:PqqD family protein [Lachnospiraceae bacterium]
MRLRKEFITHETGSESMLIPAGGARFSGLVKGNKTLGAILALLREDTTEEQIISVMKQRFDAPEEKIADDVKKAIAELRKIGAIDE